MSIYRDDVMAQRDRLSNVERERADLQQQKRRLQMVVSRREALETSLDEARRTMLDDLHIATPCPARWRDMAGDDRVRFCSSCAKNVYDVAAMTRLEAEALIQMHEGDVCLRLHKRSDGTVITADCPVGVRNKRVRRAVAGAVVAAGACVAGALATGSPGLSTVDQGAPRESEVEHATHPDPIVTELTGAVPMPAGSGRPTVMAGTPRWRPRQEDADVPAR